MLVCPGDVMVRALDSRLKTLQVRVPAALLSDNNVGQVVLIQAI